MCLEAHGNQKGGGLGRIMEAPGKMFWHCIHGIVLDEPQCGTHSISVGSPTLCTVAEGMPVKPSVKALHAMAVAATNRADLDMAQPGCKRARWSKALCVSQSASSSSLSLAAPMGPPANCEEGSGS